MIEMHPDDTSVARANMGSFIIRAHLRGAICLPNGPVALDGLLAWAVCEREGRVRPVLASECTPVDIPVALEPGGRFHLASASVCTPELYEQRWINRRFPLAEAQEMGDAKLRRVRLNAGAQKTYRLPLETFHCERDLVTWWCIGDAAAIRGLLELIGYVGKKRSTGLGSVREWEVESCEPWPGFPVMRDGLPLRPLPVDWPGLLPDPPLAMKCLTYPYWDHTREGLCAVPEVMQ